MMIYLVVPDGSSDGFFLCASLPRIWPLPPALLLWRSLHKAWRPLQGLNSPGRLPLNIIVHQFMSCRLLFFRVLRGGLPRKLLATTVSGAR